MFNIYKFTFINNMSDRLTKIINFCENTTFVCTTSKYVNANQYLEFECLACETTILRKAKQFEKYYTCLT